MSHPRVKESLESLVDATVVAVEQGLNDGSLTSSEQVYVRVRLEGDPKYTDRGVDLPPAQSETSTRRSWANATRTVVQGQVKIREFQAAVAALSDGSESDAQAEQHLRSFVFAIAGQTFELEPGRR